jgi:ABC-type uncharacterized transport system permease subunit
MLSPSSSALAVTLALYLAGGVVLGANLLLQGSARLLAWGRSLAVAGAALHAAAIGLRCVELRHAPFATPGEALSALAWMVVLAYLVSEMRWRLSAAGPFALALAFLLVLGTGVAPAYRGAPPPELLATRAISLHITAILAAFGAFALAFCCAGLYLVEHHILKSKRHLAWMKRLPPLLTVEAAAFSLVAWGFPLLTLGILSGLVRAWGGGMPAGWYADLHSLLAFTVWTVYAVYLLGRLLANWHPLRGAYVLLIGLALCLLLFFVPSAAHRFG